MGGGGGGSKVQFWGVISLCLCAFSREQTHRISGKPLDGRVSLETPLDGRVSLGHPGRCPGKYGGSSTVNSRKFLGHWPVDPCLSC